MQKPQAPRHRAWWKPDTGAHAAPRDDAPSLRPLDLRLALVARERRLASVPALAALYAALARDLRRALAE